jgi:hypothetical protein
MSGRPDAICVMGGDQFDSLCCQLKIERICIDKDARVLGAALRSVIAL